MVPSNSTQKKDEQSGPRSVFGVFSGGGVKAAAFLGAIREAEKHVKFVGWGGTSAGSIVAALLACGYTQEELTSQLYTAPYSEFFRISLARLFWFARYRGIINPEPLLGWLRQCISTKFPDHSRVEFRHLKQEQQLKIVAANVSTQDIKIYSKGATPDMEIAQAVLASCSFPLLFPPVRHGVDELVDGGVLSNFPMWLFDDEREKQKHFTPVLGFTLVPKAKEPPKTSILAYAYSVFESVLVAQDRIQEKYMDTARLANVIRISIDPTPTFSSSQSREDHSALINAGAESARDYFATATTSYGERVKAPAMSTLNARNQVTQRDYRGAVSTIARQHILHGGVARDDGLVADRVLVRYYIDLMEAVTDHDKLEVLAEVLADKVRSLGQFDRIIGIKKGNVILSYTVARVLHKPISVFKTDMSYKMGPPFDGKISEGEKVVIVDDIASDASILLNAVRHLNFYHMPVQVVVTLVERTEGDARLRLMEKNVRLSSVCLVNDEAIDNLIYKDVSFSEGQKVGSTE
jgi:NTE family protein